MLLHKRNFSIGALLAITLLISSSAVTQTIISEDVHFDTTWALSGSPYILHGSRSISSDAVLTIMPGVIVMFEAVNSLTVQGELGISPAPAEPVVFTALSDPQYGGSGPITYWREIAFSQPGAVFQNAIVRYGASYAQWGAAIRGPLGVVRDVVLEHGELGGIKVENSSVLIENCQIHCTTFNYQSVLQYAGIFLVNSSGTIRNCEVVAANDGRWGTGIRVDNASGPVLVEYLDIERFNVGVRFNGGGTNITFANNTIHDCVVGLNVVNSPSNLHVHHNNIENMVQYGIRNQGIGDLNAIMNYWGHPSGPSHPTNPAGLGCVASDRVVFAPWSLYPNHNNQESTYVSGTVVCDYSQLPVSNAIIAISPNNRGGSTTTNEHGTWVIIVAAGSGYRMEITHPQFCPLTIHGLNFEYGQSYVLDYALEPMQFSDYRVTEHPLIEMPGTIHIPVGSTAYAWYCIEGLYAGNWYPAYGTAILAQTTHEEPIVATSSVCDYHLFEETLLLPIGGVFALPIPSSIIGSGTPGSTETITFVSANGISIAPENSATFQVEVTPYAYESQWGYRVYGTGGAGVTAGIATAIGFVGGGSGSIIKLNLDSSSGGHNWNSFSIQRKNDLFLGAEVKAGPPRILDVGTVGASASLTVSFPYGEEYAFDIDQLAGLESMIAFYLFGEPALLYGPPTTTISARFLGWLVQAIIENYGDHGLAVSRYADRIGIDVKGAVAAGVSFGLGQAHDVHFGLGAGVGAHAHGGFALLKGADGGDFAGRVERSLYVGGGISGSVGPRVAVGNTSDAVSRFLGDGIKSAVNLGGSLNVKYDLTGVWQNSNLQELRLENSFETGRNVYPAVQLSGTVQDWTYGLRIKDQAAQGIFHGTTVTRDMIWNLGTSAVSDSLNNDTFHQDLVNFLTAVRQEQDNNQPLDVEYRIDVKDISRFNLSLNLEFPLPLPPPFSMIVVSLGGGMSADAIKNYLIADGLWVLGTPLFRTEMVSPPTSTPSFMNVISEIWNQVRNGDLAGELKTIILNGIRNYLWDLLSKDGVVTQPLNEDGSFIEIRPEAVPAGVDSLSSRYWTWGEDAESTKSLSADRAEKIREYNRYIRKVREKIAGMRYGVGGFYQLMPDNLELLEPAMLTIVYDDAEVTDMDESSLSIFYEDDNGIWQPVPSTAVPDSNLVRAAINKFYTYTVGPRMPQGEYAFSATPDSLPADGSSIATLVSSALLNNDGTVVPDGALFTVTATVGEVVSLDADPTIEGIQVAVVGGVIQVEYQAGRVAQTSRIVARAVNGFATCAHELRLYDHEIPSAPVIADFQPMHGGFKLKWESGGDADIAGYLVWFDDDQPGPPYDGRATVWGQNSPVSVGVLDSLTVTELTPGVTYYVAITALDVVGNQSPYSEEVTVIMTGVDSNVPLVLDLAQNFPNPFNPQTKIHYSLPHAGRVSLKIFDVRGRLVRTLVEGEMPAGRHEAIWQAQDNQGRAVASGIYLYVLQTPEGTKTRKMCVVK